MAIDWDAGFATWASVSPIKAQVVPGRGPGCWCAMDSVFFCNREPTSAAIVVHHFRTIILCFEIDQLGSIASGCGNLLRFHRRDDGIGKLGGPGLAPHISS